LLAVTQVWEIAPSLGRRGILLYILDGQERVSLILEIRGQSYTVVRVRNILDERFIVDAVLEAGRRYKLCNWFFLSATFRSHFWISRLEA
jgi:hypothetical protein